MFPNLIKPIEQLLKPGVSTARSIEVDHSVNALNARIKDVPTNRMLVVGLWVDFGDTDVYIYI